MWCPELQALSRAESSLSVTVFAESFRRFNVAALRVSAESPVVDTAFTQGLAGQSVEIQTEGGPLQIHIADDFRVALTGPASEICSGILSSELLEILAHEQP
jgi:hypothetical protein